MFPSISFESHLHQQSPSPLHSNTSQKQSKFTSNASLQAIGCFRSQNFQLLHRYASIFHLFHTIQNGRFIQTPEIQPIDHDPSQFLLTPLARTLMSNEALSLSDDFLLEEHKSHSLEKRQVALKRKIKFQEAGQNHVLSLLRNDFGIEGMIQDEEESLSVINESDNSDEESDEDDRFIEEADSSQRGKTQFKADSYKGNEEQKQSTIDLSQVDYTEMIDFFSQNPKIEISKLLKQVQSRNCIGNELQKKNILKEMLAKFLLEYEIHCYEQSWSQLTDNLSQIVSLIIAHLEQVFAKNVASISFQERRIKLLRYLQKKRRRIWRKKVSYDCRKKVADGRLRIKGKFVTREQACEQLGLGSLDNYSAEEIKQMLQRKLDNSLIQPMIGLTSE